MKQEQNEYHHKHGTDTGYLNLHFTECGQCNERAENVITRNVYIVKLEREGRS